MNEWIDVKDRWAAQRARGREHCGESVVRTMNVEVSEGAKKAVEEVFVLCRNCCEAEDWWECKILGDMSYKQLAESAVQVAIDEAVKVERERARKQDELRRHDSILERVNAAERRASQNKSCVGS